jgi:hypothetical protein
LTATNYAGNGSALSGKQSTINSTAGQLIIGNGNGSTTTHTGLTYNTSTSTLTATNFVGNGSGLTSMPFIPKFTSEPWGMNIHESRNGTTYLGFGAGHWHTQNYARINTVHVGGDVNAFQFRFECYNSWIYMYFGGTLASNTSWSVGSDSRIKCDINKIEDNECLTILRNISMYKYKLKETRQQKRYKSHMNYGFIAQDIINYLPQSVSSTKKAIPSIHKPCTIIGDVLELDDIDDYIDKYGNIFKYEYEAKINDVLELVLYGDFPNDEKDKVKLLITDVITNKKFKIVKLEGDLDYTKKWFVFGNIVDDFLSLEHNMIHNIGVGAIKCIDNDVTNLKNEIDLLKQENQILKNKLNILSNHIGLGDQF